MPCVTDAHTFLVLKNPMNKTFKVELKVMEHRCLATTTSIEEWICHHRLDHLNLRDLNVLQKNRMVMGLALINIPTGICTKYVQAKQHKGKFNKYACCRTK